MREDLRQVWISEELHRKLKIYSAENKTTMKDELEGLIKEKIGAE